VASAFALVFASSQVLEGLARARRSSLTWVHFAGVGIGIALSSQVILLPVGWEGMWFVSGAASLAGVIAVAVLIPARPIATPVAAATAPASRRGGLVRLALAYGLFGFGYVITATFLIAIVREAPNLRAFEPVAWLVVGLAAVPSVLIWVTIGRRIGLERAYALSCAVEAVGVLFSLWNTTAGILLSAVLLGGTFVGITALGLQAARAEAVGDPRRALGLMTTAFSIGQIIGPSFAGHLRDATGSYAMPTFFAAGALIVATGLTWRRTP
jgi:cyanate permease